MTRDILIIGGGIIGMLTARELSLAGARVTLIEKNQTGQESSWAGGGILSPLYPWRYPKPVTSLATWSQHHYPQLAEDLFAETDIDPQWIQSGLLILDKLSVEEQHEAIRWANTSNNKLEFLVNTDINKTEPGLNSKHTQCIHLPDIAQVRNPRIVKALKKSLVQRGVGIIENTEVTHIDIKDKRISGVKTTQDQYTAEHIIVSCGAWSSKLLADIQVKLAVKPIRGQMILAKAQPGQISNIILDNNRYIIPRRDGRVLIGSTLEDVGFDKSTTQEAQDSLWQTATELVPLLNAVEIEHHWAGLRPGTQQGIPYICEHPDIKGLFINAGHFRNGVILGLASARLMTDIISNNCTIMDPDPYAL